MRLVLTIRGTDVLDLELRWPSKPSDDDAPKLEANSGGDFERAEAYGDPDCTHGFGFSARGERR